MAARREERARGYLRPFERLGITEYQYRQQKAARAQGIRPRELSTEQRARAAGKRGPTPLEFALRSGKVRRVEVERGGEVKVQMKSGEIRRYKVPTKDVGARGRLIDQLIDADVDYSFISPKKRKRR